MIVYHGSNVVVETPVLLTPKRTLDREETLKRFTVKELYDQLTFCTEKALTYLHYIGQLNTDIEEGAQ
jgi:hypothetical protein